MENFAEDSAQISKYNDAGFSISRLHDSWILCKQYIRTGNFRMWKIELDNIWMELITDVLRQKNKDELIKIASIFARLMNKKRFSTRCTYSVL